MESPILRQNINFYKASQASQLDNEFNLDLQSEVDNDEDHQELLFEDDQELAFEDNGV